jgi:hypothetical protein
VSLPGGGEAGASESHERPRLLVLDLLETYARERNMDVVLERESARDRWVCIMRSGAKGLAARCVGDSAREAIVQALEHEGVDISG